MPLTVPTLMIKVPIGYRYLLLDATPENFEFARTLTQLTQYTTVWDDRFENGPIYATDGKVAVGFDVLPITYTQASADELRSQLEASAPAAEAA